MSSWDNNGSRGVAAYALARQSVVLSSRMVVPGPGLARNTARPRRGAFSLRKVRVWLGTDMAYGVWLVGDVLCYAPAMWRAVLRERMVQPGRENVRRSVALSRGGCAMAGTGIAYGAASVLCDVRY
eukprot:2130690-Rhodomonas_salina.2